MLFTIVVGARPNFMKVAPIIRAIKEKQQEHPYLSFRLVHTGQHYDKNMSDDFFTQLQIPEPAINLEAKGNTQAELTASIMVGFEKDLLNHPPDVVIVVGDVTSTMACALAAKKLCIDVAHVEAGIRSGDPTMPEEINRIVTDSISDYFFTTTKRAGDNLINSGVDPSRIEFVGNTMIDTLYNNINRLNKPSFWMPNSLTPKNYFLITFHRPSNVDKSDQLGETLKTILDNTGQSLIVFPVHPRTRTKLAQLNISHERLIVVDPMGYLEFIYLVKNCIGVITDSGGVTEETTVLGIPCITMRDTTERPETVEIGTNELVGTHPNNLTRALQKLQYSTWKKGSIPEYWDGRSGERIVKRLLGLYSNGQSKNMQVLKTDTTVLAP